jgi:hypothetical protein
VETAVLQHIDFERSRTAADKLSVLERHLGRANLVCGYVGMSTKAERHLDGVVCGREDVHEKASYGFKAGVRIVLTTTPLFVKGEFDASLALHLKHAFRRTS